MPQQKPKPKPKSKSKSVKKGKNKKRKKKTLKTWDGFNLLINAFLYQWKYRDIFIECDNKTNNDEQKEKQTRNKHAEFESHYLKLNTRSMHYRSILYNIYELIYVFLTTEFTNKWFPKYYCDFLRHHYNFNRNKNYFNNKTNKNKNRFKNVPKLHLLNGIECELHSNLNLDCKCQNCKIRENVDSWKDDIVYNDDYPSIQLKIPYIWQVINARIFHWIWAHNSKTKLWIKECRPNDS